MRPRTVDELVGSERVLGERTLLGQALRTGSVPSVVLFGPPGCGKTTLARLLAEVSSMPFEALSAVTSGVKDVRAVIAKAKESEGATLLFVDEIHRFNKAQQDAFLPHIEDGTIVLVGATTENPGFSLIRALQSRVRIVRLPALDDDDLRALLTRALEDERGLAGRFTMDDDATEHALHVAGGDARRLLNVLESAGELAEAATRTTIARADVEEAAQATVVAYDRSGDDRYDLLSAFHKSLRGSDVDASLYWMARMLHAGEDPRVILRRLIAMASEDIGLADPLALRLALDAKDALEFLGQPEGELSLCHAVAYAALAPKSNTVVKALGHVRKLASQFPGEPVPLHIRNAPTAFAKGEGHGAGYAYPHDHPNAFVPQAYLPEALDHRRGFEPKAVGAEREIEKRWAWWKKLRQQSHE